MSSTTTPKPPAAASGADAPRFRLTPLGLAIAGVGVLAGALVWVVGLPDTPVWDTTWASMTTPVALFLALTGLWLAAATSVRRSSWRVTDIVVASVLGVAGAFVMVAWTTIWEPITAPLAAYPPASALLVGVWLLPGVLGALIVRKPGAAVYTELVAAVIAALVGNPWGFSTVYYGLLEGLGAEVVFALLLYRRWGLVAALLGGLGTGITCGLLDVFVWYTAFEPVHKVVYIAFAGVSGVVLAGLLSWLLTRALAATGALAPLASGRDARRV